MHIFSNISVCVCVRVCVCPRFFRLSCVCSTVNHLLSLCTCVYLPLIGYYQIPQWSKKCIQTQLQINNAVLLIKRDIQNISLALTAILQVNSTQPLTLSSSNFSFRCHCSSFSLPSLLSPPLPLLISSLTFSLLLFLFTSLPWIPVGARKVRMREKKGSHLK